MKMLLTGLLFGLLTTHAIASVENLQEKNKKVVLDFYEMAFNKHRPTEAAKKHIGTPYVQHNPFAPNGQEAFYKYFEEYFKKNPKSHIEVKRVIAESDLVALHLHSKLNDKDKGQAIVDIFRVKDGKIVEHWDVAQDVPTEKLANDNTMF